MTRQEVMNFTKKINAYYRTFTIDDADIMKEWIEVLEPYRQEDIIKRFNEHLNGENSTHPPLLHLLIKNLRTSQESAYSDNDFLIRCDLCGDEMHLSDYNTKHRKKCLVINALIPVLKEKGQKVEYKDLDQYDFITLERIYEKYIPIKKDIKEIIKGAF